ncbi:MAG: tetratricopeptide repeat protein [Syntrophaceae bacterium]
MKRLLLEELGTYLENITEVQNFKLTKDQITTLTAGIIKAEIVEEKWNGRTYWMKSKIAADSDKIIKSIDVLRKDHAKTKELEEVRRKSEDLIKENKRLRKELAAKGEKRKEHRKAYDQTIKDLRAVEWVEKAYADYHAGNKRGAIAEFSKAIELNPKYAEAYNGRGTLYNQLGKYDQAIDDFDKAMEINPKYAEAYNNQGCSHSTLEMNPKIASCYYNRGIAYGKRGNYNQAVKDYSRAIELNPKFTEAYTNRGIANDNLSDYNQAIKDYSRAIEINPKNATPYYNRGIAYHRLGNRTQAIEDYKIAARLGSKEAQDYLRTQGIGW